MNSKTLHRVSQKFIFVILLFALITNFSFPSIFTSDDIGIFINIVIQFFVLFFLSNNAQFRMNYLDIIINLMSAYSLHILITFDFGLFDTLYLNYDLFFKFAEIYALIIIIDFLDLLNISSIVYFLNRIIRFLRILLCITVIFYYCFNGYNLIYSNNFSYQEIPNTSSTSDIVTTELTYEQSLYNLQNKLTEDNWNSLTYDEKIELLQEVVECESLYLGIKDYPLVYTKSLTNLSKLAFYSNSKNEICINDYIIDISTLSSSLNIILHETYHTYQHELCDAYAQLDDESKKLYIFNDIEQYIYEFTNYIDCENDYDGYYDQLCELYAREHAENRVSFYYNEM